MKNNKLLYIFTLLAAFTVISCNDFLDREPISSITPEYYFNNADQLGAYAINYYTSALPVANTQGGYNAGPILQDQHTDNLVYGDANTLLYTEGLWLVPTNKNINYTNIRAMNYFLEQVLPKYEKKEILGDEQLIKQYIGEVYFMRASFYFSQLVAFGDFPIITKVLAEDKNELIEASKRFPRNEVARFILEDLDKAIEFLQSKAFSKQRISKEVALLLKARVALFEATFEKYHSGTPRVPGEAGWPGAKMQYNSGKTFNIPEEIKFFLTSAMEASKLVADAHPLVENSGVMDPRSKGEYLGWNPYFEMFSMPNPSNVDEVLLWRQYNTAESITTGYNPYIMLGGNYGATRSYVESFLMKNGLPIYATNSGYKGDVTINDVVKDRDERLELFMFKEKSVTSFADTGVVHYDAPTLLDILEHRDRTGYRIKKHLSYDPIQIENGSIGTNAYVVFRAVEAYLIYMEASYLKNNSIDGTADKYWRAIRKRAGIDEDYNKTIKATDLSKEPDWAKYSGSELINTTLYNIRRERRCEFIGEGMRMDDLKRWRSFDALFSENMGKYIPEGINLWDKIYSYKKYFKLDKDGKITNETALIQPNEKGEANVSAKSDSKYLRPYRLRKENNLIYDGYSWKKAHYLTPISLEDMTLTSTDGTAESSVLYQNPYWPNQASQSALE